MKSRVVLFAATLVTALSLVHLGGATRALAHGPDPRLSGTLWARDQVLGYTWRAGQVPPDWMAAAIDLAAGDVSESRVSRAATFARVAGASSLVAYGEPTGCSTAGLACFDRSGAPKSFRMWFRAHGYRFDWGTLRWCQAPNALSDGCFDAETIALDELGHVEILDHHANLADGSDYDDAVVQALSHARPAVGWDSHALGRCDVARLQLEYERPSAWGLVSTCLHASTATTLTSDVTSLVQGEAIRFTATLKIGSSGSGAMAGDPLSGRAVTIQRRTPGSTSWSSAGTMTQASVDGIYVASVSASVTYEWRAVFATPTNEGLSGSASGTVKVTVVGCTLASLRRQPTCITS